MDGTITSNESPGSPPQLTGSVRSGMIFTNSAKVPGQPCVRRSGRGFGPLPRSCTRWTPSPSTRTMRCASPLRARSLSRQSNPSRQWPTRSRRPAGSRPYAEPVPTISSGQRTRERRSRRSSRTASSTWIWKRGPSILSSRGRSSRHTERAGADVDYAAARGRFRRMGPGEPAGVAPFGPRAAGLRQVAADHPRDRLFRLGADDLLGDLAVLEEEEGWNAHHPEAGRDGGVVVHVELSDARLPLVLGRELLENRGHRTAGGAPGRPEVHEDGSAVFLCDLGVEVGFGENDHAFAHLERRSFLVPARSFEGDGLGGTILSQRRGAARRSARPNFEARRPARRLLSMPSPRRRRSLGQHFLRNLAAADQIVSNFAPAPGEVVLEIGPGHGVLTERLLAAGARVLAIEKDAAVAATLADRLGADGRLHLVVGDALETPIERLLRTLDAGPAAR